MINIRSAGKADHALVVRLHGGALGIGAEIDVRAGDGSAVLIGYMQDIFAQRRGFRLRVLRVRPGYLMLLVPHQVQKLLDLLFSLLEGAVFPVLAAFVFSRFMGTSGAWLYFLAGETLTLLFIGVLIFGMTRKLPWQDETALLLKKDFGVSPEHLLEMDIRSMQDVVDASQRAGQFCRDHGHSERVCNHIALCIEEMAANTIQHGFTMDRKHHDLSVRLLQKEKDLVLRFRDDCGAFDPVRYIPKDEEDALGIRLILAFAQEARYTYALNLNNVCIRISVIPGDLEI